MTAGASAINNCIRSHV